MNESEIKKRQSYFLQKQSNKIFDFIIEKNWGNGICCINPVLKKVIFRRFLMNGKTVLSQERRERSHQ